MYHYTHLGFGTVTSSSWGARWRTHFTFFNSKSFMDSLIQWLLQRRNIPIEGQVCYLCAISPPFTFTAWRPSNTMYKPPCAKLQKLLAIVAHKKFQNLPWAFWANLPSGLDGAALSIFPKLCIYNIQDCSYDLPNHSRVNFRNSWIIHTIQENLFFVGHCLASKVL
jgi:hypothetical protein